MAGYDVVLLANTALGTLLAADAACTVAGAAFLGAASRGTNAFIFVNLHSHTCASAVGALLPWLKWEPDCQCALAGRMTMRGFPRAHDGLPFLLLAGVLHSEQVAPCSPA